MNPLDLALCVGLYVSAAHAEYKFDITDVASGTPPVYRCVKESISQSVPGSVVVISEKPLTLEEKIDEIVLDHDNFEEDEPRPSATAVSDLKRILGEASRVSNEDIPDGDVLPYFGELSITWRRGNKMLRLTAFSNGRNARLDYGTTPERSLGVYEFNPAATGENLVDQLRQLATDHPVVEDAEVQL